MHFTLFTFVLLPNVNPLETNRNISDDGEGGGTFGILMYVSFKRN